MKIKTRLTQSTKGFISVLQYKAEINNVKKILILILALLISAANSANSNSANYLPAEIVFKTTLIQKTPTQIQLVFDIAKDYDVYANHVKISADKLSSVKIGSPIMPTPILLHNDIIGDYTVYKDKVFISIPVTEFGNGNLILNISFQGCKNLSYCYPPVDRILNLKLRNRTNISAK